MGGNGTLYKIVVNPTVAGTVTATAYLGRPFSYQIESSGADATSFSATGLPAGLSVNAQTGLIAGTPTVAGTFPVTLGATNAYGTGTLGLSLVVQGVPVLTSAASVSTQVNLPFSYQVSASGAPTGFAAAGLPPGLAIDATTGLISGTPTLVGTYAVSVLSVNQAGPGTATVTLSVLPPPGPVLTLVTTTDTVTVGSGEKGVLTLSLSYALASDLIVNLQVTGTAANGQDYVLLKATKKIKAGKTSKKIKVVPLSELPAGTSKTVDVQVVAGEGYNLGDVVTGEVKILAR